MPRKSPIALYSVLLTLTVSLAVAVENEDRDPAYHHTGELAGSLKSADPLPVYDSDPGQLWNRLFAAISIRPSLLPSKRGGVPVARIEGGDVIDFLAWPGTTYWDEPATVDRIETLLDEFLEQSGEKLTDVPLRRVLLQRDLWAVFDFYISRNIARTGDLPTRQRRTRLCRKLAQVIRALALNCQTLGKLPDNYALAVSSGHFAATHEFDPGRNYLPPKLLTDPNEWPELDFYQPKLSEDVERRFVFLHMRAYKGRSYFRVFYRFPKGRTQLEEYLKLLDKTGVDWRSGAQHGSLMLKPDAPQIPVGTEVALVQFLIALDNNLTPIPTRVVESVRVNVFKNVTGEADPTTNTKLGLNVAKYTLKRRLALATDMKDGGLHREPDDLPAYRVIFESENAVDWGPRGRSIELAHDCRGCHAGGGRTGVFAIPSLVNSGGIDSGAQLGIVHTTRAGSTSPHPARTVKWKTSDETYRRLIEFIEE